MADDALPIAPTPVIESLPPPPAAIPSPPVPAAAWKPTILERLANLPTSPNDTLQALLMEAKAVHATSEIKDALTKSVENGLYVEFAKVLAVMEWPDDPGFAKRLDGAAARSKVQTQIKQGCVPCDKKRQQRMDNLARPVQAEVTVATPPEAPRIAQEPLQVTIRPEPAPMPLLQPQPPPGPAPVILKPWESRDELLKRLRALDQPKAGSYQAGDTIESLLPQLAVVSTPNEIIDSVCKAIKRNYNGNKALPVIAAQWPNHPGLALIQAAIDDKKPKLRDAPQPQHPPIIIVPGGGAQDKCDDAQARWGRERDDGFQVGQYFQTPPLLFTADHHPLWLGDLYRGHSCFLICGGPSFGKVDHAKLRQPGIMTMALNNSPKSFRPDFWCSVDDPGNFIRSIWFDPRITKFVPICHTTKNIFDSDKWQWTNRIVRNCPNVVYYKRNEHFRPGQFLWENTFNWGCHKDFGGGRSVMLPALRILYILGFRRVYLLGCDLTMNAAYTYHFDQKREKGSVAGNNSTYEKLKEWFGELRPNFEQVGFFVYNVNPDSALKVFDFVSFDDAVRDCATPVADIDLAAERTNGLYDEPKPKYE